MLDARCWKYKYMIIILKNAPQENRLSVKRHALRSLLQSVRREPNAEGHVPSGHYKSPAACNAQPATRNPQPASSTQHPASGFTLLEVMIAMAIMAIVLISVYRLHSQTLTMATANRFYTQAPLLAQSKMAQLEAISSDVVSGDSGDFGDKFPGYAWSVSTEEVSSEALGETAGDLNRIDVTVTLNQNEYEYTIRLYRLMAE
jgi:general secretion pathway protein I